MHLKIIIIAFLVILCVTQTEQGCVKEKFKEIGRKIKNFFHKKPETTTENITLGDRAFIHVRCAEGQQSDRKGKCRPVF